jgi:eukaryotic-like serine/threonine-protein kinase
MSADEESRDYLQRRLALFAKLLFAFLVLLSIAVGVTYELVPELRPAHHATISAISIVAMLLGAGVWVGVRRRKASIGQLFAIDTFYAVGCGVVFGSAAYLSPEFTSVPFINLIWTIIAVFARTMLVPSTGARTAVVSGLAFLPMIIATIGIAIQVDTELTDVVFISGSVAIAATICAITAIGSSTIYGLRRQFRQAMQLGQYTLERKIGEGGMGIVYLARHALLRRPTAIKTLLPDRITVEALNRFEREVQHMAGLTHANTVAVYDYGRSPDGTFYYAMEYLGGGVDLERLVSNYGPQPPGRVIRILRQACRALQEAHDRGVIHRDIKPANMILCERGGEPDVIKVVDFGLAKEVQRDTGASTNVVLGTPAYLAPEAITNPNDVGPSTDLYALGCVAYYLLSGKRVFTGATAVDICVQHVSAAPRPIYEVAESVDSAFGTLIMSCLAKSIAERPASARMLDESLLLLEVNDWSDATARQWWSLHRTELDPPGSGAPTVTMAVDLTARGHVNA